MSNTPKAEDGPIADIEPGALLGYFWVTIDEYGDMQQEFLWNDDNGSKSHELNKYLWDNQNETAVRVVINRA